MARAEGLVVVGELAEGWVEPMAEELVVDLVEAKVEDLVEVEELAVH